MKFSEVQEHCKSIGSGSERLFGSKVLDTS